MLIFNFSHPLTDEQLEQVEEVTGGKIKEVRHIATHFDSDKPFGDQVEEVIKACDLTPDKWQTLPILIVPPSLNFIAVTLIAALHGLMGYFPPVIRLKPVEGSVPPRFEVAEVINLQAVRERFRGKR